MQKKFTQEYTQVISYAINIKNKLSRNSGKYETKVRNYFVKKYKVHEV